MHNKHEGKNDNIFPNLFIIGAAKSGTTSLHYYLSQHPDIFMSVIKEPHFFSTVKRANKRTCLPSKSNGFYHTRIIRDLNKYLSLFESEKGYLYKGESSPSYLYDAESAKRIYDFNPHARIIIILREPCDRAFSHYLMDYNLGKEKEKEFIKAVEKDFKNQKKLWGESHLYVDLGLYFKQIGKYYKTFPSKQIYLLRFEDLIKHPIDTMVGIMKFLKIDITPLYQFDLTPQNQTKRLKNRFVHYLIYTIKSSPFLQMMNDKIPLNLKEICKKKFILKTTRKERLIRIV